MRYADAVEHLKDCAALDVEIKHYNEFQPHISFIQDLKTHHSAKTVFWDKLNM